jgi:hypothetical protein
VHVLFSSLVSVNSDYGVTLVLAVVMVARYIFYDAAADLEAQKRLLQEISASAAPGGDEMEAMGDQTPAPGGDKQAPASGCSSQQGECECFVTL